MLAIIIFLVSIVIANLSVAYFGPVSTPFNAFFLIGLDLTLRDKIHEQWHGRRLGLKMAGLIAVGAVITYILNRDAGMVCVASVVAFSAALLVDFFVYEKLFNHSRFRKINGSNILSSAVDSVLFPTIAFGMFMPWIVVGQFLAKVVGGFLWGLVLFRK